MPQARNTTGPHETNLEKIMAATKKALELKAQKEQAAQNIRALQQQVKEACNRVPKSVMAGDAIAAAEWRTMAENVYMKACSSIERGTDLTKSNSLNRLHQIAQTWVDALREVEAQHER